MGSVKKDLLKFDRLIEENKILEAQQLYDQLMHRIQDMERNGQTDRKKLKDIRAVMEKKQNMLNRREKENQRDQFIRL